MKIRRLLLLASVVLVCLLLLTVQTRNQGSGAADLLAYVTTPLQLILTRAHRAAVGVWSTYREWRDVRAENARLREEVQRLRVEALQSSEVFEENRRLRTVLELQERLPLSTTAGEVIARESGGWVRSLTVNRGRGDRVGRLTAVISPDGLVGRVVDVRPTASIVQIVTDPASTVGAHLVRTRTTGIVEGEPRGTMRFKYMARDGAGIAVGDLVVTSGAGGLFPRGIPIGRVVAIDNRASALFNYASVAPVVDLSRIEQVLLVRDQGSDRDLATFFAGGR